MPSNLLDLIAVFTEPQLGFTGNTAAVLLTEQKLPEERMTQLAADFNQPASTFLWPAESPGHYHVRWLAPDSEIGLCGHGSLAAVVYLARHGFGDSAILHYRQGEVKGRFSDGFAYIELAGIPITTQQTTFDKLEQALGVPVKEYHRTDNKDIVLLNSEAELRSMKPDFAKLRELKPFGYSVTAPGDTHDFVSRTLVPHVQQLEDHATGSSHAALVPFWSERLRKQKLSALQLSPRGGSFECEVKGDQVILGGKYSLIASGQLI